MSTPKYIGVRRINPHEVMISFDAHYGDLLLSPETARELAAALTARASATEYAWSQTTMITPDPQIQRMARIGQRILGR